MVKYTNSPSKSLGTTKAKSSGCATTKPSERDRDLDLRYNLLKKDELSYDEFKLILAFLDDDPIGSWEYLDEDPFGDISDLYDEYLEGDDYIINKFQDDFWDRYQGKTYTIKGVPSWDINSFLTDISSSLYSLTGVELQKFLIIMFLSNFSNWIKSANKAFDELITPEPMSPAPEFIEEIDEYIGSALREVFSWLNLFGYETVSIFGKTFKFYY